MRQSDPKELAEAVRIVREKLVPIWFGLPIGLALETVLAALEAAGAWQADRAAVCEDRERLIGELAAMERARDAQRQLYKFEFGRAAAYERERDEAQAQANVALLNAVRVRGELREARAQLRQAEILGDQAEQELEEAERERDEARAEVERLERMRLRSADWLMLVSIEEKLKRVERERDEARAARVEMFEAAEQYRIDWKRVERERDEVQRNYDGACQTIAKMHEVAMGSVCGPVRGVVEDVADVRTERDEARAERDALRAEVERNHEAIITMTMCGERAKAEVERLKVAVDSIFHAQVQAEAALATERERLERLRDLILAWADTQASSDIRPFSDLLAEARCIREDRAALAPIQTKEKHEKHPTNDYCVYCRAQWPCEEQP